MVLHCNFHSPVLRRYTHINVILPTPTETGKKVLSILQPVFMLLLLLACTAYLIDSSFNPFLYFRF